MGDGHATLTPIHSTLTSALTSRSRTTSWTGSGIRSRRGRTASTSRASRETAWTFGCPAGDDVNMSVGQNAWGFNSYCGSFFANPCSRAVRTRRRRRRAGGPAGADQARPVAARAQARCAAGRGSGAAVGIPRGLRLAGATVRLERLLFERRGHGELTRPRGSRAPRPLKLRRTGAGPLHGGGAVGPPARTHRAAPPRAPGARR